MGRKQRTPEVLREASNHLHYEYRMFTSLAGILALDITGKGVIHNALLEAFTIHARGLLKFLYPENPKSDDVIAEDFFPIALEWKKARPKKTKILKKAHERVGKEVAHLTYARQDVTPEKKPWPFLEILRDMEVSFKKFLQIFPEEFLGKRWEKEMGWIRKLRETT